MSRSRVNEYSIVFASARVQKEFEKDLKKIPGDDAEDIKTAIRQLKSDPRQKSKKLRGCGIPGMWHRIRVGNYRVLYDIDDENHNVILMVLARRNERTYK